jgi:hypothetical protein
MPHLFLFIWGLKTYFFLFWPGLVWNLSSDLTLSYSLG